jgi:hypothetical protein
VLNPNVDAKMIKIPFSLFYFFLKDKYIFLLILQVIRGILLVNRLS